MAARRRKTCAPKPKGGCESSTRSKSEGGVAARVQAAAAPCYGTGALGMRMRTHRSVSVFILIGAVAAALSLAACGRKGGLDLPPSASVAPAPVETKSVVVSPIGRPPKSEPRVVPQRSLPIDVLLN